MAIFRVVMTKDYAWQFAIARQNGALALHPESTMKLVHSIFFGLSQAECKLT
jgi:hypothetical protein